MSDFGLVFPFQIDDGQLDGLTPQMCFVLGYELAIIYDAFERGVFWPGELPVHVENQERIEAVAKKHGIPISLTWAQGDVSEAWLNLRVLPH